MSYSFNIFVRTNLNKCGAELMICRPNSYDLWAKFLPVRVCMILSRSKFVGPNLRRSEFTFHDSAPLINLHSMLGWLVGFWHTHFS